MFILNTHFAFISSLVSQLFLMGFSQTLWFFIIQISIVDSAIRILYSHLSPILGFLFHVLKFAKVHLVMLPMFFIDGHVFGLLSSQSSLASLHIRSSLVALHSSKIWSRSSVAPSSQDLQVEQCSPVGYVLPIVPNFVCVM